MTACGRQRGGGRSSRGSGERSGTPHARRGAQGGSSSATRRLRAAGRGAAHCCRHLSPGIEAAASAALRAPAGREAAGARAAAKLAACAPPSLTAAAAPAARLRHFRRLVGRLHWPCRRRGGTNRSGVRYEDSSAATDSSLSHTLRGARGAIGGAPRRQRSRAWLAGMCMSRRRRQSRRRGSSRRGKPHAQGPRGGAPPPPQHRRLRRAAVTGLQRAARP